MGLQHTTSLYISYFLPYEISRKKSKSGGDLFVEKKQFDSFTYFL